MHQRLVEGGEQHVAEIFAQPIEMAAINGLRRRLLSALE